MSQAKPNEGPTGKAKIFLVDDHPIVRQGLARLIEPHGDLCVCGEAPDARGAIMGIADTSPDVAVIDISLDRDLAGIELIKDIKNRFPKLSVLVLSMHNEEVFAERAIRAGAKGYVMKDQAMETVLTAIRQILRGEIYLSDTVARSVLSRLAGYVDESDQRSVTGLTNRELEVFELIGRGYGTSHIAEKLFLSIKTVETHRAHIKEKLKIGDPARLIRYAIEWVQSEDLM